VLAILANLALSLCGQESERYKPDSQGSPASHESVVYGDVPSLTSIKPVSGEQGQQNLSVLITGQNTHFIQGKTSADFGSGIHVVALEVKSSTTAISIIDIDLDAKTGPRDVTLTTNDGDDRDSRFSKESGTKPECETATLRIGFTVTPAPTPLLIQLNPNTGQQGQLGLSVTVTGQYTHFKQGKTTANFGAGVGVVTLKVNSPTSAVAVLNIDPAATIGPRNVTLVTQADSEQDRARSVKPDCLLEEEKVTLQNGFTVIGRQNPVLTQVNPGTGQQGQQSLSVTITGQYTHFSQGVTTANFGLAVTVVSVNVNSATSATAVVNIDPAATIGTRNVTLTTNSEVATLANGFAVTLGSPVLTLVSPKFGQQGQQSLAVTITGQYTHFVQGTTIANFGSGVTVASVSVNSATNLSAIINIDPAATIGVRNLTVTTNSELVVLSNGFSVTAGTPVLTLLNPNSGQQGQQNLSVTISGQYTHFAQGVTAATFGSGVAVVSVTVISPTSATVAINIDPAATVGARNVTLTSNAEVVTLANSFTVAAGNPALTQGTPNTGQQGQQNLAVTITGQYTHFSQGVTTVTFGSGITVVAVTVHSATSLTALVNIDPAAATGIRSMTLTTSSEVVTLANSFTVTPGTPALSFLSPNTGQQGQQSLSVAITGQYTHFAQGTTTTSFGPGITVASLTVNSATTAIALININPAAATGTQTVTVTTGTETESLTNAFTVTAGTPVLLAVSPNSGQQGQQGLSVAITSQYTHFSQGVTTANFGAGITVVSVTVNSTTGLTAVINIDSAAATGVRGVMLMTNTEVANLANSFTVTPGTPVLTVLSPNAGQQGQQSLSVAITGQYTHFVQGTTTASFGSGVTVVSITVNSSTSATAIVNIDPAATIGTRTVTLTTNTEMATQSNSFAVTAGTPILTLLNPNTGQQGQQNLSVALTGQYTHFSPGSSTASFGLGITVTSVTVTSPTSATAIVTIDPAATVGIRDVTLTTSTEVVTLASSFTVAAASPVLTQFNPSTGQQGQQSLSVAITGQYTHFVQGTTTASFGAGVTVVSLTVNSASSATAVLNIDPAATAGARTVTVTTGMETESLANEFSVNPGTPVLTSVNPATGQLGQQNLPITLTGQFTHWAQRATTAGFGSGITVNSLTVNSATSATAVISIGSTAAAAASTVTVTTGSEVVSLTNGFTVLGGQVTLSVQPPTSPTFDSSQTIAGGFSNGTGQTTLAIAGGASAVSQIFPTGQSQFGLSVPLRPNSENLLTVTATDSSGQTATASNLVIVQLTPSKIVQAQVTAQRLSTPQVQALVSNGTISLSNPANYNVSMFAVSLSVGGGTQQGPPPTLSVPVVEAVGQNFAIGPSITIQCQNSTSDDDDDISQDGNTILVPCGTQPAAIGPISVSSPKVVLRPVLADVPGTSESIPGILVIDGTIKTLKEFFNVNLILMNTSSDFTISGISAKINIPDSGLSPVVPAGGSISIDDLSPNTQGSGQFVIRGDVVGTHTVTVNFGASVGGPLLNTPIPISGSASTDVTVEGPPPLNVTVEQPASVTAGVPYNLKINITNTSSDLDALYGSLALNLGGASLIDPTTGLPSAGSNIVSLGNILAGQSESLSYTVIPNDTGPIVSCVGAASENITLSVVFTDSALGCATGTLPSQTLTPSGQPTVAVLPAPNTVNVPVGAPITLLFSDAIQTGTVTASFSGAAFNLTDPSGATVPVTLQFATLPNGATVATYRPISPLKSNTVYQVVVSQGIYDTNGMQLASGVAESFTTAPPPPADTTPPVVAIQLTPPADPASVPQGQLLQVLVNATDDSGAVSRVDLLLDGQLVDSRAPQGVVTFLFDTSALNPGSSHVLTAVATDPSSNTAQTSLNITVSSDNTPPTVALSAAVNVLLGQMLPISIQASDNVRVARVDLFVDGGAAPVYTGFVPPYQTSLDTTFFSSGQHQLRAVATDGAGNIAQTTASFLIRSVTAISLSPGAITLTGTGYTQPESVIGTLSDGTTTPLVSGVTFVSANPSVAVISSAGVVTSVAPGTAKIAAVYPSLPLAEATVTDLAATPVALAIVSGNNQTGQVSQQLAAPLVVEVTDANNQPVPNIAVSFSVQTGGTVGQSMVSTNTQGLSSTTLTLGQSGGVNSVTATVAALPSVSFVETGTVPPQTPTLINPGNQTSVEGATASLALMGNDPDGDALIYSAVGLPAGLSINPATGLISGKISVGTGTYPVTTTVADGSLSASQFFTWTVTAPQTPFVDVSVAMSAAPNPDPAGVSLAYTLSVSNLGTAQATGVVVSDTLPPGTVLLSASQGCANTAGTVTCNIGTLAPVLASPITIAIAAFAAGQVTNSATATLNETDSAPANNTATLATNVVLSPLGPGLSPTNATDIFDPRGLTWASTGGMTIPRAGTTLTVLGDGTVLVLGGVSAATDVYTPVSSGETFDPSTGTWTPTTAPLSAPRAFHTATLLPNGSVLVVGGLDSSGNPLATAEIYQGPPIQKTTPVLTWPVPAAIAHGTPLSAAQLNATASVPGGSYTYSPPVGTVLAVGSQTLSVLFTPTDTIHYATATTTVTIMVTP
jgi:hypothetical protein